MLDDEPSSLGSFLAYQTNPWPSLLSDDFLYALIIPLVDFLNSWMVFDRTQFASIDQLLQCILIFMLHREQLITKLIVQGVNSFLSG